MTDERHGGTGDAADKLQERLTRRFDAELAQAERDYPTLSVSRRTSAVKERGAPARTRWPKLASAVVAVGVLAVVGMIGVGLASRPPQVEGPAVSLSPRGGAAIPTEIDGQRVYTMTDRAQWQNLSSSFLLAAYPVFYPVPCASGSPCNNWALQDNPTENTVSGQNERADGESFDLAGWAGVEVVMRVDRSGPGILTVQAVVWPDVPTQLNGEKVYRATDQASFPTSGSFLFGGRVSKPDLVPPCPMPLDKTQAEQQLIPYCYIVSIDGLGVAPKSSFDAPKNEIVVVRVHINDSQAVGCPAVVGDQCKSSLVVESVEWRSDVLVNAAASSSPLVGPSLSAPPSQTAVGTGEGTGPASPPPFSSSQPSIVAFGQDGVPVSYGGQTVYRAAKLPANASFLLGGVLGRDGSCAAPTGMSAQPPACGYWTVDGLAVGNMVPIQDSMIGSIVVVQIQRSKALGVCSGGPCRTTELLVVTQMLWSGPPAPLTPPPTAARSAS